MIDGLLEVPGFIPTQDRARHHKQSGELINYSHIIVHIISKGPQSPGQKSQEKENMQI